MVPVDFFAVPTIRFQILYVFLVLGHERRRIVHFAVMAHPTAEWTAQQLREGFPWDIAPRYLLRDRDRIFGKDFVDQVKAKGIQQVLSAPRSPWQRAYVERVIGTIRRESLDHMIVFGAGSLYRHLQNFINPTGLSSKFPTTNRSFRVPTTSTTAPASPVCGPSGLAFPI
jgi:putative transposase